MDMDLIESLDIVESVTEGFRPVQDAATANSTPRIPL